MSRYRLEKKTSQVLGSFDFFFNEINSLTCVGAFFALENKSLTNLYAFSSNNYWSVESY